MTHFRTILAVDHDRKACETYRANMPGVEVVCGDVSPSLILGGVIDVLCGGLGAVGWHGMAWMRKAVTA